MAGQIARLSLDRLQGIPEGVRLMWEIVNVQCSIQCLFIGNSTTTLLMGLVYVPWAVLITTTRITPSGPT